MWCSMCCRVWETTDDVIRVRFIFNPNGIITVADINVLCMYWFVWFAGRRHAALSLPSLCAGAPWQLWDLRTDLDQGQEVGRQDHKCVSLQLCATAPGLKFGRHQWVQCKLWFIYWFILPNTCHEWVVWKPRALNLPHNDHIDVRV